MYTPVTPLLAALLTLAAPPPPALQTAPVRSSGDNSVSEVGGKNLKQWLEDLKNQDASVREEAIRALVYFRQDWPRIIQPLVERLQHDTDSSPRVRAAIALGMIDVPKGVETSKVVQALSLRLLEDPQSIVRYYSAATLLNFGDDAREALAGLNKGAADPATWEIRHACVIALRAAGHDSQGTPIKSAELALLKALHDPTYQVRLEAIMTIGALGRPDDVQLGLMIKQGLQDRLVDRDPTVKIWAYTALMALDETIDKKHLQAVSKFLKGSDKVNDKNNAMKVRLNAARALGTLGDKARDAAPALVEALDDKETQVVGTAAWALTRMGGLSGPSKGALLGLLKNPDPNMRATGAQSLGLAGIKARAAVPALTELVMDKTQRPVVVASGCWALGEIGEPDAQAVAALKAVSERQDVDESLKEEAIKAIDKIHKIKR
jgi:HEAT repeat protein